MSWAPGCAPLRCAPVSRTGSSRSGARSACRVGRRTPSAHARARVAYPALTRRPRRRRDTARVLRGRAARVSFCAVAAALHLSTEHGKESLRVQRVLRAHSHGARQRAVPMPPCRSRSYLRPTAPQLPGSCATRPPLRVRVPTTHAPSFPLSGACRARRVSPGAQEGLVTPCSSALQPAPAPRAWPRVARRLVADRRARPPKIREGRSRRPLRDAGENANALLRDHMPASAGPSRVQAQRAARGERVARRA